MESAATRALIRQKLQNGDLPLNGIPRFWIGPSNGEECDGCGRLIVEPLVVGGIAATDGARQPIQMHVECFTLRDEERREPRS